MFVGNSYYCDGNLLKSLEGIPNYISDTLVCNSNKLTTLKFFPIEVGANISIFNNDFPEEILENQKYLKEILKYQNEYGIWNSDNSHRIHIHY